MGAGHFQDPTTQRLANRVQINRFLRDWVPLGQRIHGMGTKIGSKYRKTRGAVKKDRETYVPFVGVAEAIMGKEFFTFPLFLIFGLGFGTHSRNIHELSVPRTQEGILVVAKRKASSHELLNLLMATRRPEATPKPSEH